MIARPDGSRVVAVWIVIDPAFDRPFVSTTMPSQEMRDAHPHAEVFYSLNEIPPREDPDDRRGEPVKVSVERVR